jgi:undecaprenyl-diphosphatase
VVYLLIVLGGSVSDLVLKEIFARQRPTIVPHLVDAENFSFPSGHAAMSVVIYVSLALIMTYSQINMKLKLYIISAACFLALLVGFSRIYLGVHYPTDVLAGWLLGMFWVLLGWLLIQPNEMERFQSTNDE